MPPRVWSFRYDLIDGLRGLAALAVVTHHLGFAQIGPFAVMTFFVISGYCIAASAEQCRRTGLSVSAFMWRRARRIYPPYLLAIAFYVLTRLLKSGFGGHDDLVRPWLDWVQNLTLTQWVSLLFHPVVYAPENPKLLVAAFWSLCYEEQFYLVMALALLLAVRRRVPIPLVVLALAAVGLVWNTAWPGGWVTGFFLEYWVHFAAGAMLFYVLCVTSGRLARAAFVAAVTVLGLVSLSHVLRILPWHDDGWLRERAYVELTVVCAFVLMLFFVRPVSVAVSRADAGSLAAQAVRVKPTGTRSGEGRAAQEARPSGRRSAVARRRIRSRRTRSVVWAAAGGRAAFSGASHAAMGKVRSRPQTGQMSDSVRMSQSGQRRLRSIASTIPKPSSPDPASRRRHSHCPPQRSHGQWAPDLLPPGLRPE